MSTCMCKQAVAAFVAFLCARLLEVSAEERAAHAIQRLWRTRASRAPGAARAHLQASFLPAVDMLFWVSCLQSKVCSCLQLMASLIEGQLRA